MSDILELANAILEDPDPTCGWTGTMIDLIAEVERLRSERDYWRQLFQNIQGDRDLLIERDARIKELEAHEQQTHEILGKILGNDDSLETVARRAITKIERLEAAFLRSNAAMRYYQEGNRGPWPQVGEQFKEPYIQKAREALKRIKDGGKDEDL